MATMIKVTRQKGGKPIWMNTEQIQTVYADEKTSGAHVWLAGDNGKNATALEVRESAEQVIEMISRAVSPTEPVS